VIFDALKAILYLGNLLFEEGQSSSGSCSIISADTSHCLTSAADLLGFDENELIQALTTRTIHARGETMIKPLSIEQAQDTKNAFVKEIYGRLFSCIVTFANKSLAFSTSDHLNSENDQRAKSGKRRLSMQGGVILSIGLLDIFGFEIFTSNSFEQLW
jgi:myosin heavy subunit